MKTLLMGFPKDRLEPDCYPRALRAATRNNNNKHIGMLLVKGADNAEECLDIAIKEKKVKSYAMLLLIKASMTGSVAIVQKMYKDRVRSPSGLDPRDFDDDLFPEVQSFIRTDNNINVVPMEIARRNGHHQVRENILMNTDVNRENDTVLWHGLRLLVLDVEWLRKISWVKRLRLARNAFRSLPQEMGVYLNQVSPISITIIHALLAIASAILISVGFVDLPPLINNNW